MMATKKTKKPDKTPTHTNGSARKGRSAPTARPAKKPALAASGRSAPTSAPPAAQIESFPGTLPHSALRPSPTNPRKTFDEEKLQSLADSIRQVGIRQRLVVRPIGLKGQTPTRFRKDGSEWAWSGVAHYEIVAGERRWRAAKRAGLAAVPVDVAELTDEQVLIVQLVENDQRDDLVPSEQARAYARLADRGMTADQIQRETGKPLDFVRRMLAFARLDAEVLAAVDAGRLPAATAAVVARVPNEAARRIAGLLVLAGKAYWRPGDATPKPKPDDEPLSFREARALIADHFQKELKSAPFSRTALDVIPDTPSCDACPKRAGNAAKDDPNYKEVRADTCLDPRCYQAKLDAFNKKAVEAAKGSGRTLLTKRESETLFNTWNNGLNPDAPYVDLSSKCYQDRTQRCYKTLLASLPADQVVIAVDHAGQPHELVEKKVAAKVLRDTHKIGVTASTPNKTKEQVREDHERKVWSAVCRRCQEHAASVFTRPVSTEAIRRAVYARVVDEFWSDTINAARRRRGWDG